VLITGAAGGLGQGLVKEFAGEGWRVAAGFHRTEPQEASERVWPLPLDVTTAEEVRAAVNQIKVRWGRLDVLINNAGITRDHLIQRMDEAAWEEVVQINLKGAFLCSQAVLPIMVENRDGHIVNISSFSGRVGVAGQTNYAAAKAGLIGFTQALAKEVGSQNVRVNCVLPGLLPTPMTASLPAQVMESSAQANALGRINSVVEVARFVVFLASLQNVSGQLFQLDSRIARSL
jgi:3-oxoacyl-[acyl-carrier protein] reductase